jgi:hypothetical protein
MKPKLLVLLAFVGILVIVLGACRQGDDDDAGRPPRTCNTPAQQVACERASVRLFHSPSCDLPTCGEETPPPPVEEPPCHGRDHAHKGCK